jgi:hypothetical protein
MHFRKNRHEVDRNKLEIITYSFSLDKKEIQ